MNNHASLPLRLENAVQAICPEIWQKINVGGNPIASEDHLWEKLVCCVLSSQVKFEIAEEATKSLESAGLLRLRPEIHDFERRLRIVLNKPICIDGRKIRYRFPNSKAFQLAKAKSNLFSEGIQISKLVSEVPCPMTSREKLTKLIPGLGMKQGSMFLRNIGKTYDLAVIDTHVLRYMKVLNIIPEWSTPSVNTKRYLVAETKLLQYAKEIGYPVGCLDFAIWIVMRVAQKEGYV